MSGENTNARLKRLFGAMMIGGRLHAPVSALYFHPEGHALRHPRAADHLKPQYKDDHERLRDDIAEKGVEEEIIVREEEDGDNAVLAINDGANRTNAALAAEKILKKDKKTEKTFFIEGQLYVPIKVIKCSDADFLLMRQSKDRNRFKREHTVAVLCTSIVQMYNQKITIEAMLGVLSRTWTKPMVQAVIDGWHKLTPELQARFESADERYVAALPLVFKAKASEREQLLTDLLASGAGNNQTMVKWLNQRETARAMGEADPTPAATPSGSGNVAPVSGTVSGDGVTPDIEDDGLDLLGEEDVQEDEGEDEEDEESEEGEGAEESGSKSSTGKKPTAPKAKAAKRGVNAKRVKKTFEKMNEGKPTLDTKVFVLMAAYAADPKNKDYLKALIELLGKRGLDSTLKHAVAGVFWKNGVWGAVVQGAVNKEAIELVETVRTGKAPKEGGTKGKGKKKAA